MSSAVRQLLPPNASPQERALEGATARIADVAVDFRPLWDADSCPADLLPWLAWGLSVDTWNPAWPEAIKRAQIRTAIAVHRKKGTVAAVMETVEAFGGALSLVEWWQMDPPGPPYTFEINLTVAALESGPPPPGYIDDIIARIDRVKNARSHFTFTQGLQATGGIGVVAAARTAVFRRLRFDA